MKHTNSSKKQDKTQQLTKYNTKANSKHNNNSSSGVADTGTPFTLLEDAVPSE